MYQRMVLGTVGVREREAINDQQASAWGLWAECIHMASLVIYIFTYRNWKNLLFRQMTELSTTYICSFQLSKASVPNRKITKM